NTVLENINLPLSEGHVYGLLGENGVGKTTLLTLLAGLKAPKTGSITVEGKNPSDRLPSTLADQFYLPDEVLPLRQSAERFGREHGIFWPNFQMDKYYDLLKIFEVEPGQRMDQMSAGQLKKTWIAFGLACHTKYYYMDEPTNGLDIPSKAQFRKALARETADDSIVILSTHQVRDLEDIIDSIVILEARAVAVNASLDQISRAFRFETLDTVSPDALYNEMIPGGIVQVLPNDEGVETKVNIEAFFNALHASRERVITLLSNRK
ncbi:MAG: ATP-binding cassette domain-containing protein, partial [Bacteroidota bacterium]|nr:ATP-binding cassette domain-containing protein [Bacteroidota bacterium]